MRKSTHIFMLFKKNLLFISIFNQIRIREVFLNKLLIAILKIQIATNIKFGGSTTRSHHALEIQRYNIHVHVLYMMIGKFPKLASGKCVKLLYPRFL
jgi:hypothetical protein